MGIQINHYDMPINEFDWLESKYPNGRYGSAKGTNWFTVCINEMDLELIWFMESVRGATNEE